MNAQWKTRMMKVAFWVVAEITLNLTNLDVLANYSEFVFAQRSDVVCEESIQPILHTMTACGEISIQMA